MLVMILASKVRGYVSLYFILLFIVVRVKGLRYLSGDFLTDPAAISPDGTHYPKNDVDSAISKALRQSRRERSMQFLDNPWTTRKVLLEWQINSRMGRASNFEEPREIVQTAADQSANSLSFTPDADSIVQTASFTSSNNLNRTTTASGSVSETDTVSTSTDQSPSCDSSSSAPQRLCKTKFNTTAPMYGVSLTSGKTVTIVQKFPDLLQQVIFEVCATDTCDVVHGECVQTYMPYLFLVIPLGPVTLTGQDYILVESGCVCRPKYAGSKPPPNPLEALEFGQGRR